MLQHDHWADTYDDTIRVCPLVLTEFLALSITPRTNIDALAGLARRIGAFDSNGVCEVTAAAIAFNVETRFIYYNYGTR